MSTCSTISFSICWCFLRFSSNSSFLVLISSLRLCTSFLSISTNCSSCSLFFLSNSSCCFLHFSFSCEYYNIERQKDSSFLYYKRDLEHSNRNENQITCSFFDTILLIVSLEASFSKSSAFFFLPPILSFFIVQQFIKALSHKYIMKFLFIIIGKDQFPLNAKL